MDVKEYLGDQMVDFPILEVPKDIKVRIRLEGLSSEYKAKCSEVAETSVAPFLSEQTTKSRRSVLLTGTICTGMAFLKLLPTKIPALGIESISLGIVSIMTCALAILVYQAASFLMYFLRDCRFRSLRIKRLSHEADALGYQMAEEGITENHIYTKTPLTSFRVATIGVIFEVSAPFFIAALGTIGILLRIFAII